MGELVSRGVPSLPPRPRDAHKGTFGTTLVIAGSEFMLGAAILCARAALRGGSGLVRVALPKKLCAPFLAAVPAATAVDRSSKAAMALAVRDASSVVVGPGLGDSAATKRLVVEALANARCPVVLDADALNVLAPCTRPIPGAQPKVILPHPGEAARLLACSASDVQQDRRHAVSQLSARTGAVAVLKGAATLVCEGARMFTNDTGNPGMATGGSGDVLAGLTGALLAQGMEPFEAACLAVHTHGAAGDLVASRLSQQGLIAEDLPLAIAEVLGGSKR